MIHYKNILPFLILLISISSITQWCNIPIGNTILWWCINSYILICFYKVSLNNFKIRTINIFIAYLVFSAIYGAFFFAKTYWDWKLLISNLLTFSLAIAAYTYSNPQTLLKTLRIWFKYIWIIIIPLIPYLQSDAFGRILVPFCVISLLLPVLNKKYIILCLVAYAIVITMGSDSRSDMIKFTICIILSILSYFNQHRIKTIAKVLRHLFLISPFIFFILGCSGIFNIFQIEEELNIKDKFTLTFSDTNDKYSALMDTRTFLYKEQISSALKHQYLILGHSIARGHDSAAFGSYDKNNSNGLGERASCEVSILNIFNYFGIIGVIIYFLIFYQATYYAITTSQNKFLPIIGTYVAFRWSFAWIEDFSTFDLNHFFLWVMIGICYSPYYRNMSDRQFLKYTNKIIR